MIYRINERDLRVLRRSSIGLHTRECRRHGIPTTRFNL